MECHKSSSKREIHSKCLPQEVLKISNKQFFISQGSRKEQMKFKARRWKEITKSRAEINEIETNKRTDQ